MLFEAKAPGKLLITGEYAVLHGALALALPTRFGQSIEVDSIDKDYIDWRSYDDRGQCWFSARFSLPTLSILESTDSSLAQRLVDLLSALGPMSSHRFHLDSCSITTRLDFPRDWGLGSSSTLIALLAQWAQVDAFELSERSFGGSGYDVAVAEHASSILYRRVDERPEVIEQAWNPPFHEQLQFVHLGRKQDSRASIAEYRRSEAIRDGVTERISAITEAILGIKDIESFAEAIQEHEALLSSYLDTEASYRRFPEAPSATKYLGGWGGDFALFCGEAAAVKHYAAKQGLHTVLSFEEMIAL